MPTAHPTFRPVVRFRTQRGRVETWRGYDLPTREEATRAAERVAALEAGSAHPWIAEWTGAEETA